jgi:hypothetical protein
VLQTGRLQVRFPMVPLDVLLTKSFRSQSSSGVDPAFNRNEYQEYFPRVKAAGA